MERHQPRRMPRFALVPCAWVMGLLGGCGGASHFWSNANGTFTGTTGAGVAVSGTVTNAEVYFSSASGSTPFLIQVEFDSPGDQRLALSTPTGLTSAGLSSTIVLTQTPAPGSYTESSADASGGVQLDYTTETVSEIFSAESASGNTPATGTWTLTLTAATADNTGDAGTYFTPKGTLQASMADLSGGTGTLKLTF